ncbi:MAG TPA: DUF1918 domain-containing protein [Actinospica sp.]|jgi:hypothetical protein|nr:DUF1918 domain-containing protein [Actinospica sp.]
MKANVGDRLIVLSRHIDETVAEGEILEVHGVDGDPPFLVRWAETGREALVFPGPDARVIHRAASSAPER